MKLLLSLIIYLSLLSCYTYPQDKVDSLENVLRTATEDTNKVKTLFSLYRKNFLKGNYDTALYYARTSLTFSGKINYKTGMADAYNNLGNVYYERGIYDTALQYQLNSLKIREEIGDKKIIAFSMNDIGNIYKRQKQVDKAMEYFSDGLKLSQETGDKRGIALGLINTGTIYRRRGNTEKSLNSYLDALKILQELNDKQGVAICMNNLGNIFNEQGNIEKALFYQHASLKIKEELGDKRGIAITMVNIFETYSKKGDYKNSLAIAEKALVNAREIGAKDLIRELYQKLSETLAAMGNYKDAYRYHLYFSNIKDTLLNEESSKQIAEMQAIYENEKKQKEIELLNKEKKLQNVELEKKEAEVKKQNIQKLAFGAGFVMVLILALVIFGGYKQKEKSNLLLARQKQQIEIKNSHLEKANIEITEQKKEIQEKNNEILSSIRYAQRIQEAILPPQKLVKSYLENSFILYKPKDIVAGDFYWMDVSGDIDFAQLPEKNSSLSEAETSRRHRILFAVCDCTGHGVPGAFVSIVAHNALNRAVKEFGLSQPSLILDKVNELVQETFSKSESDIKDGMDIALCALELGSSDLQSKKKSINFKSVLQYAGANNSIYFIQNNLLTEIRADVQPIGKYAKNNPFTNHAIEFQKGDVIYAFTDGYADQFGGPKGKKFKYSQFEKLLLSIQEKSMSEQREILNETIDSWKGELEQIDDICIIGVRV